MNASFLCYIILECAFKVLKYIFCFLQTYDVWSGRMHSKLSGHYDDVNCCAFHSQDQVPLASLSFLFSLQVRSNVTACYYCDDALLA